MSFPRAHAAPGASVTDLWHTGRWTSGHACEWAPACPRAAAASSWCARWSRSAWLLPSSTSTSPTPPVPIPGGSQGETTRNVSMSESDGCFTVEQNARPAEQRPNASCCSPLGPQSWGEVWSRLYNSLHERTGDRGRRAVPPAQVTSQRCLPPLLSVWHLGTFLKRPHYRLSAHTPVPVCVCVCMNLGDGNPVLVEQNKQ